jgi:UDP-N-acetyl-D-galactosamine dehydrogenase
VILSGRRINDDMGAYIGQKTVKKMIAHGLTIKDSHVLVMGLTFKENCPDIRNSKVIDIINELRDYGIKVSVTDPLADREEAMREYDIRLDNLKDIKDVDAIILAVSHQTYRDLPIVDLMSLYRHGIPKYILMDVKSIFEPKILPSLFDLWRL